MTQTMIDYERMLNDRAAIANQKLAIDKWDGKLSEYMTLGAGISSPIPLMNMKKRSEE